MGLTVHFEVLNQLGTPMMYSATLANRPAAGIAGRIFFRTDSPFGIFRDTGSAWDQISSAGGNTIYTADDTLTSNRTVSSGGFTLVFTPQTTFFSSLTAAVNASSFSVLGSNTLNYAAAFSSNNIGNVYSANGAINSQIFNGNATFAQANLASAMVNVNKIDFSSGGHTVTMTQSSGIRTMSGVQNQIQFVGSHNGTITHAAVSQNLGFFRDTGSTRTLTISNAYSHLINALDDYGSGFTFTNRWGIYQAGASDTNYFAANTLFGTTVNAGFLVDIAGTSRLQGNVNLGTTAAASTITLPQTNGFTDFVINNNATAGVGFRFRNSAGTRTVTISGSNLDISSSTGNISAQILSSQQITIGAASTTSIRGFNLSTLDLGGDNTLLYARPAAQSVLRLLSGSFTATAKGTVYISDYSNVAATPNGSAQLQVDSTVQGFLPPRMTTTQKNAIGSPAAGLVIYDTTLNKLCVYTTAWETVNSI
jgi:hypothetical protein